MPDTEATRRNIYATRQRMDHLDQLLFDLDDHLDNNEGEFNDEVWVAALREAAQVLHEIANITTKGN